MTKAQIRERMNEFKIVTFLIYISTTHTATQMAHSYGWSDSGVLTLQIGILLLFLQTVKFALNWLMSHA